MTVTKSPRPSSANYSAATTESSPARAEVAAVFGGLPGGVIGGGEIILLAMKPSMWQPLLDSAPWILAAGFLTALLTALGQPIPGMSLASSAQIILFVGFARLAVATAQWAPRWHVLTNRRIIDVRGIRQVRVDYCPLVDIRNTYVRPSSAERVLGLGTILFATVDDTGALRQWRSIRDAEAVHAKIRRAIENALDSHPAS
jgi:hypothetical protein